MTPSGSSGAPGADSPLNLFRRIRFADTVRVSGDAFTLTVLVDQIPSDGLDRRQRQAQAEALARDLDAAVSAARPHLGASNYRFEPANAGPPLADPDSTLGSLTLTVHAHGIVTKDQQSFQIKRQSTSSSADSSGGELWVNSIDFFQDSVRETFTTTVTALHPDARTTFSWLPGEGVLLSGGGISSAESTGRLEEELWSLKARRRVLRSERLRSLLYAGVVFVVGTTLLFLRDRIGDVAVLLGAYSLLIAVFFLARMGRAWNEYRESGEEIRETLARIEVKEISEGNLEAEVKAYKLFQVNTGELKRYYDQALRQRGLVFGLGVLCIFGGFAFIIWAFLLIQSSPDMNEKVLIAVLGATGAFLADFVAVIFLRMFSQIVQSTVEFHSRLVGTHHAHFGNVLAARISETGKSDEALADMARVLALPGDRVPEEWLRSPAAKPKSSAPPSQA